MLPIGASVLLLAVSCTAAAVYPRDAEAAAMVPMVTISPTAPLAPGAWDTAPTVLPYALPPNAPAAPVNVAAGVLTCHAGTITESLPQFYMTRNEAAAAIATFCGRIPTGVAFKNGGTPYQYARADGPYAYPMTLSAMWMGGDNCPTTDFSNRTNVAVCNTNLLTNVVDACNTEQNGLQFWKGGGVLLSNCIAWGIQRTIGDK